MLLDMEWGDAECLSPGDKVIALSVEGPLPMRVIDGPVVDGEFEVMILCEPADWAVLEAGGAPGDIWDEWRFAWPIEALERPSWLPHNSDP